MRSTRNILSWVAAGVAVLSLPAAPRALEAQTSDLLILVAPVTATEPVDRRFGERIAEEIRDALKIFPGYLAVERDDARDAEAEHGQQPRIATRHDAVDQQAGQQRNRERQSVYERRGNDHA